MSNPTILKKRDMVVTVSNSQLAGMDYKGRELFHGGALPDDMKTEGDRLWWPGNSNITMFPIVGPTDKTFKIKTDDEEVYMDQHGIARIIGYENGLSHGNRIILVQKYRGEKLMNPKFIKDKKRPEFLEFPHPYTIEQNIIANDDRVWIEHTIRNDSNEDMKYNIGQHPCIKIEGNKDDVFITDKQRKISLEELAKAPGRFILLNNTESALYVNLKTGRGMEVSSENYGHMMLWTPGNGDELTRRACIEPVTELPNPELSHFQHGKHRTLEPGKVDSYLVEFKPYG